MDTSSTNPTGSTIESTLCKNEQKVRGAQCQRKEGALQLQPSAHFNCSTEADFTITLQASSQHFAFHALCNLRWLDKALESSSRGTASGALKAFKILLNCQMMLAWLGLA